MPDKDSLRDIPWTKAEPLFPGKSIGTSYRPAGCLFSKRLFVAWATQPDAGKSFAASWSFTSRGSDDQTWSAQQVVPFNDSTKTQQATSALAIFDSNLYAFVPWKSATTTGLDVFGYNGNSFEFYGSWGNTWGLAVTALTARDGTLHVVGRRPSDNYLQWTYIRSSLTKRSKGDFVSGFSTNARLPCDTKSNHTFFDRLNMPVIFYIFAQPGNPVMVDAKLEWKSSSTASWYPTGAQQLVYKVGSGISSVSIGDAANFICYKQQGENWSSLSEWDMSVQCYGRGRPLGDSAGPFTCKDEAQLFYAYPYIYAVWNSDQPGNQLQFSRILSPFK